MDQQSLQDKYSTAGICFGCGPSNEKGLQIKSFVEGEQVVAHWHAQDHHQAFAGVINGGIIGALLDCHSNWTAAWHLMQQQGLDKPPCTVTADYHVKLRRPTPLDREIKLVAKVIKSTENSATISAELLADDKVCATCEGTFVSVEEGHPAFHRW